MLGRRDGGPRGGPSAPAGALPPEGDGGGGKGEGGWSRCSGHFRLLRPAGSRTGVEGGGRQARPWLRVFSSGKPRCHGVSPGREGCALLPAMASDPRSPKHKCWGTVPSLPGILQTLQISSVFYTPDIQSFPHTKFQSFTHTKFPEPSTLQISSFLPTKSPMFSTHQISSFTHQISRVFHTPNFQSFTYTRSPVFSTHISKVFHTPNFQFSTRQISNVFHTPNF